MKHPLDELTTYHGKLMQRQKAPLLEKAYLDTPAIMITGKGKFVELPNNEVSYTFKLSHPVDAFWNEIFKKHLDIAGRVFGSELEISCIPANLEWRYARAKEAIEQTNREYAKVKEGLLTQVAELEARRKNDRDAKEQKSKTIRDQFDELEL